MYMMNLYRAGFKYASAFNTHILPGDSIYKIEYISSNHNLSHICLNNTITCLAERMVPSQYKKSHGLSDGPGMAAM